MRTLTKHLFRHADKKKRITDGELKKLRAHIDNGDEMLDNNALESYRKKIIDELGKGDNKTSSDKRKDSEFHRNHSRFSTPGNQYRDDFMRKNNEQSRRNNNNSNRGGGARMSFQERNRINNRNRGEL